MQRSFVLLISLAGCAGPSAYARVSAGHIGCAAQEIEISQRVGDEEGPRAWTATCGGRSFACSSGRELESPREVVCTELGAGVRRPAGP